MDREEAGWLYSPKTLREEHILRKMGRYLLGLHRTESPCNSLKTTGKLILWLHCVQPCCLPPGFFYTAATTCLSP